MPPPPVLGHRQARAARRQSGRLVVTPDRVGTAAGVPRDGQRRGTGTAGGAVPVSVLRLRIGAARCKDVESVRVTLYETAFSSKVPVGPLDRLHGQERLRRRRAGHADADDRRSQGVRPASLPPRRALDIGAILPELTRATQAVGELKGIGRTVPDPLLLVRPIRLLLDAVAASAEETIAVVERLQNLQRDWRERFQTARRSALMLRIIDLASSSRCDR